MREAEITPIRIARLELPPTHPEAPGRATSSPSWFAMAEPASIDTGVGERRGHRESLRPAAPGSWRHWLAGVEAGGLSGIANSHLHFDHCGNNDLFPGVPIFIRSMWSMRRLARRTTPCLRGSTSRARTIGFSGVATGYRPTSS
jgi:glyoxylase-like metal-dependent hydrolase (beta-lactamase superfamily II)